MFAKTKKSIINLAAIEKIQLSRDTLEFYGLDGGMHHQVVFSTPQEAEQAFQLLAFELKAKGELLMVLEKGE